MATITLTAGYDTQDFWTPINGSPIEALGHPVNSYRFQNTALQYVVVSGTGFAFDLNGVPTAGTYTSISIFANPGLTILIANYTNVSGLNLNGQFTATDGLAGNDTIISSSGGDIIDGGDDSIPGFGDDGMDTVSYANAISGVSVTLDANGEGGSTGDGTDVLHSIDNAIGSNQSDAFYLTESVGRTITGGNGSDTVDYSSSLAGVETTFGAANTLSGIDGLSTVETIIGSSHNDTFTLNNGSTDLSVTGGDDTDTVVYSVSLLASAFSANGSAWKVNAGTEGTDTLSGVEVVQHSGGNVLLVGSGGFTAISDAVAAANAGDTILIASGTYNEGVIVDKALTFIGVNSGGGQPIVTNTGGSAFVLSGPIGASATVSFDNIAFNNSGNAGIQAGVGVVLGTLSVTNSSFTDNFTNGVSVIDSGVSNATITNSTFSGNGDPINSSSGDGEIIFFNYNGNATLSVLTLTGSPTFSGENGIQFRSDTGAMGTVSISNVTIYGTYEKQPIQIANYDNIDGLTMTNVTVNANSAVFNTAINIDGVGGNVDLTNTGDAGAKFINVTAPNLTANGDVIAVQGDATNNIFTGNDLANYLRGFAGNDSLNGGYGDDLIFGNHGNDTIDGGAGTSDTAAYTSTTDKFFIQLDEGSGELVVVDETLVTVDGTDRVKNVEKITFGFGTIGAQTFDVTIGTSDNDTTAINDAGLDLIFTGAGNDTLTVSADGVGDGGSGGSGIDTLSFAGITDSVTANLATGDASSIQIGNDGYGEFENLIGGTVGDTLTGDGNANILDGGGGDDSMTGGAGNDTYKVDSASDEVNELGGGGTADTIETMVQLTGALANEVERLTLLGTVLNGTGNALNNTITGNASNNTLDGSLGADTMIGGDGDDTYFLDNIADLVTEHAGGLSGTDTIKSSVAVSAASAANIENFEILGNGAVNVTGNSGANIIIGGGGKNTIDALAGNDTVDGGLGDDILKGGADTDLLTYDIQPRTAGVTVNLALTAAQTVSVTGITPNVITEKDTITGFENLTGTSFADVLTGNASVNTILGLGGDDIIQGGALGDFLDGGSGTNTVSYQASAAQVNVNLAIALQTGSGDAGGDTLLNFQNVIGSTKTDLITGSDLIDNVIEGLGGADFLFGGTHGLLGDTVSYQRSATAVNVNMALGTGTGGDATGDSFSGFENLTGSKNNDTLTGDAGINVIKGGLGDDTIQGGAGADTLSGETNGTVGDTVSYAADTAGVTVNLNIATQNSVGSDAHLDVLTGFENLIGGLGNDTLTGDLNKNTIDGGAGDDTIEGGLGDDILKGGTAGQDTLTYASSAVGVTVSLAVTTAQTTSTALGNPGKDTISGFERLIGSAFNDTLTGDLNANVLTGGDGDDLLQGRAGADTLNGGGGLNDTASYAASALGVVVNLNLGTQDLMNGLAANGDAAGDILSFIENLIGSAKADTLIGDVGNNVIEGGAGADNLTGGGGIDTLSYERSTAGVTVTIGGTGSGGDAAGDIVAIDFANLRGSAKNDSLTGNTTGNTIDGSAGDDTIQGGLGADILIGGLNGTVGDTVSYALDTVGVAVNLGLNTAGGDGSHAAGDTISLFENVTGGSGNDTLTGDGLKNTIDGGLGDDTIEGGLGDDILKGGGVTGNLGSDWLSYASATAGLNGAGITVRLALTTAQSTGTAGKDTISGFENLIGSAFDDVLTGSSFANTINGGGGNDVIQGGALGDILYGGEDLGDEDIVSYAASTLGVLVNLGVGLQATMNGAAANGDAAGDTISGFEGIRGSSKADTLTGDAFDNIIEGRAGADRLNGDLQGSFGDVVSYERSARAVSVNLLVQDGVTAQTSGGDAAGDILTGFENVVGSKGADTLIGDGGANILVGALGADKLTGGGGVDTFLFEALADKGDTILDFLDGTDKIGVDLEGFGIMSYSVQTGLFATVEGAVFVYDNLTGKLFYDADGNAAGVQVQIATLTGTNSNAITMSLLDFENF